MAVEGYHHIEVPDAGLKFDLPKDLAYCDSRQYREMSDLMYKYQCGEIDILELKYAAVYRLLNLKMSKASKSGQGNHQANIYQLSKLVDTFFEQQEEDGEIKLRIAQNYVHNPIPVVQCGHKRLYGPEDYFADISFGQYVSALNHLGSYFKDQDKEDLYALFAVFYKSKKSKQEINKKNLNRRISLSRKAYWGDIYGFFLLFASFQNYLTTASVTWEGKELDLSILYSRSKEQVKSSIPGLGMKSMTYILAESSVFGSLQEVEQTNFWEVILRMYDIKKRDLDELAQKESSKQ